MSVHVFRKASIRSLYRFPSTLQYVLNYLKHVKDEKDKFRSYQVRLIYSMPSGPHDHYSLRLDMFLVEINVLKIR